MPSQGEISPALNPYKKGQISISRMSGFILRNDGTYQFRDAVNLNHTLAPSILLGRFRSDVLGINLQAVQISDTQSKIFIYGNTENATQIATPITINHGTIAKIKVQFKEVDVTGLLSVNTPSSNSIIFVTGFGINLKYIDSSYTLKDFKVNNGATTNTPIVTHVALLQMRLATLTDQRFIGSATTTVSGQIITFSKIGYIDYFIIDGGAAPSAEQLSLNAFEVVPRKWDDPYEVWGMIVERKQMVVLTSAGLNVCKALDEDNVALSSNNVTYFSIDRTEALPILPVVFANYLTYATQHGLRYRPYAFVSVMYSPQVDPGCFEMPTESEEIENITDLQVVHYYNAMVVIADGICYAFHQPKVLGEGYGAIYARSTLFKSDSLNCLAWDKNIQIFEDKEDKKMIVGFSDSTKGYLNIGASSYKPKLTINTINSRQITITLPYQEYISKLYIQFGTGAYTLFYRNTTSTFTTDDTKTTITTGEHAFFPVTTSDITYFLPVTTTYNIERWALIGTVNDAVVNLVSIGDFDLNVYDIDAIIDVQYHMFVEDAQIILEADTPPGIQSEVKLIRLHFSKKTHEFFKMSPSPNEDQKAGVVVDGKSYPATLFSNFTTTNNMFNINLTPLNVKLERIYLYRIMTL